MNCKSCGERFALKIPVYTKSGKVYELQCSRCGAMLRKLVKRARLQRDI